MKGPAIFLAQFISENPPFNTLDSICKWVASLGYRGVQIPSWDSRLFDLNKAGTSRGYCEEIKGVVASHGLEITELAAHLQGQMVATNPSFDTLLDGLCPEHVRGNPSKRSEWAVESLKLTASASNHLGLDRMATFSGALLWPFVYPWPQRPKELVNLAFRELAAKWEPIMRHCDGLGVDLCYEIHPGEDLHDGVTFEMFLERSAVPERTKILYDPSHFVLQQLDYLEFIDFYHSHIRMFHVKDAEFNPTGRAGVYGGYQDWINRPGRFRSLGDGQVDFRDIFSKLSQYGFDGWAVVEWECCIKSFEQGAREGAPFIADHLIQVAGTAFDDFAGSGDGDDQTLRKILGLTGRSG